SVASNREAGENPARMRVPVVIAAGAAVAALAFATPTVASSRAACLHPQASPAYAGSVRRALLAKQDVWGKALIARPNGPTYASVRRLLKPLLFARSRKSNLTTTGVYYIPFAQPLGVRGAETVALHVADGSEILSQTAKGPSLKVFVGAGGRERYGSCLARLAPARLAGGFLPILETPYVDAAGTPYRQRTVPRGRPGPGEPGHFL